mgnify:CR=1 FL=1
MHGRGCMLEAVSSTSRACRCPVVDVQSLATTTAAAAAQQDTHQLHHRRGSPLVSGNGGGSGGSGGGCGGGCGGGGGCDGGLVNP